jgi:acyl-coenzyme A synthetase/AMP-(fatty) acid ligase
MLARYLQRLAVSHGNSVAVAAIDGEISYAALADEIGSMVSGWAHLRCLRVGLCASPSARAIAALAALDELGCDAFLSGPSSAESLAHEFQLGAVISQSLGNPDSVFLSESTSETTAQAPGVTILTSGTTGKPKAAKHTWESLSRPVRKDPDFAGTRWLLAYPINLYAGLQVALQTLLNGATLIIPPDRTPVTISTYLTRWKVEYASGTPTFWRNLILFGSRDELSNSSLKQITMGGEPASQETLDLVHQVFPEARIVHVYATTELGRCFSVTDKRSGFPSRFLDSASEDGIAMRIQDGVLEVRSANAMTEYDSRSSVQGNTTDWFSTGDVVELRGDRVLFLGRKTDVINAGGHKVYPAKIEEFLRTVPGVAAARVYPKSNPITSEIVAADIVIKPGFEEAEVKRQVSRSGIELLAGYERPRLIRFVTELPVNAAGKIQRTPSSSERNA